MLGFQCFLWGAKRRLGIYSKVYPGTCNLNYVNLPTKNLTWVSILTSAFVSLSVLYFGFNTRTLKALIQLLPVLQHLEPRAWLRAHGKKNTEPLHQIQDFSKSRHARKRVGKCTSRTHRKKRKTIWKSIKETLKSALQQNSRYFNMLFNVTFAGAFLIYLTSIIMLHIFKYGFKLHFLYDHE